MDFWFDDGVVEDFTKTRPFLQGIKRTGVFAVVTGWVGKPGYMNIVQLKKLIEEGHKIASHGTNHKLMKDMDLAETKKVLVDSKTWICRNLGVDASFFVAPWNMLTLDQRELALKIYPMLRPALMMHFHSRNQTDVRSTITAYLSAGCPGQHKIQRDRYDASLRYVKNKFRCGFDGV